MNGEGEARGREPLVMKIDDLFIWDLLEHRVPEHLRGATGATVTIDPHDRTYLILPPAADWITDGAGLYKCRFFGDYNWHSFYREDIPIYRVTAITWRESITLEIWNHWQRVHAQQD